MFIHMKKHCRKEGINPIFECSSVVVGAEDHHTQINLEIEIAVISLANRQTGG